MDSITFDTLLGNTQGRAFWQNTLIAEALCVGWFHHDRIVERIFEKFSLKPYASLAH